MYKKSKWYKTSKLAAVFVTGTVLAAMLGTTFVNSSVSASAMMSSSSDDGKYYSEYTSLSEAQEAAAEVGEDLGEEGSVLLKNKNNTALPLQGNERVSILGVSSDSVEGGETTVADSLSAAGFSVNPELVRYYSNVGTEYGVENVDQITGSAKSSLNTYNDVAVVIFSRTGGESNDCATVTDEVEDNKYGSSDQGWTHNALKTDSDGNEYKHYLQLTDSEEELLELAKSKCKKVIVVINSSNVMELGNLQNDNGIDGIIWVGRPGADGLTALGKILNGTVNPSGKTVDIYPADLTADPTWYGYGSGEQYTSDEYPETYFRISTGDGTSEIYERQNENMQASIPGVSTGYSFTMYSEGIYMGYRYYETADYEAQNDNYDGYDYDTAVVYPFGYGLSYTTFEKEIVASDTTDWGRTQDNYKNGGTISVGVKVTNTGSVAGKEVVQIYAHAPYTEGEIAKSEVVLVGYAKTSELQPGASETVTISVNIQDIASFDDYDNNNNGSTTYELDAGSGYELRVQSDSHTVDDVLELDALEDDIILDEDDYTGNTVEALFSGNNEYNSLGWDSAANNGQGGTLVDEGKMTIMSRDDFAETFPQPKTAEQLVRSDEWFEWHESYDSFNADDQDLYKEDESLSQADVEAGNTNGNAAWTVYAYEFAEGGSYANWKQAAEHASDYSDVTYKLSDMTGIPRDDTIIVSGVFAGKTGNEAWEIFMNQLTWDELVTLASNAGWGTPEIESIGKAATSDNDGPNNLSSTYSWGDEVHIASTWNVNLAYRQGVAMGNLAMQKGTTWYGPAMNTHRSAFGGRCNEYYSQDGYQGGMIGAAVIAGAQSKGVICYVKHCAMNDQEIYRMNLMTLATEQSMREIYLKQFQIAIQEGGCEALMTTYGSIGEISGATNYNFMTLLIREEWGFDGYAVTDAWMPCKDYWPLDMLVRAGCDAPLENVGARSASYGESGYESYLLSGTYDAEANVVYIYNSETGKNDKVSYTQWYCVRKAAENILYTQSNANVTANGYDLSSFAGGTLTAASQGVAYSQNIGVNVDSDSVVYTLTSGALPDGLTLSDSGVLSGTPLKSGTYTFTIEVRVDNWITQSATYTLTVNSAFSTDEDISTLETGDVVDVYVESSLINASDYDSMTYEITSGSLPTGLSIDAEDGRITGVVTEAGTYNVTITVTAVKTEVTQDSSGGTSTSVTTLAYDYDLTITVTGDNIVDATISSITVNTDGNLVVSYSDGTSATLTIQAEADKTISNISVNSDGNLVVTYSDSTSETLTIASSSASGTDDSASSDDTSTGCSGTIGSSLAVMLSAAFVTLAAIAVVRRRKNSSEEK